MKFGIFLIFLIFLGLLNINTVKAQDFNNAGNITSYADCAASFQGPLSPTQILVYDAKGCEAVSKSSMRGIAQSVRNWLAEKAMNLDKWAEEKAWAIAYKKSLHYFLSTFAYDTATYLATGDEGQKPMFYTEGWGEYLKNTADNAAGVFLETIGREGYIKFNLCQPNFNASLKINLGLLRAQKPGAPECTFSKMLDNWENELNNPNFLNNFQAMFNPWENDLGIALSLQSGIENEKTKKLENALNERIEGDGFKPVKDAINDFIRTPGDLVAGQARQVINEQTEWEKVPTGDIFADAIDIFVNTLAGKLLDSWFKQGLVSTKEDNSYDFDKLSFESGGGNRGGIKAAKERFRKIIEPNFFVRGDYNILAELTQCADPTKAGPTNCVITNNFRQAISEKLTVGEAMKQGYLNPNGIFGFTADGLEPPYNEGYPYRSMIILRKFRILPVGWEVAGQYIKECPQEDPPRCNIGIAGTKNLEDLVNCFAPDDEYGSAGDTKSWCQGLVDPNWVLKAPLNYCKREGPGPEITNEQIIGTGEDSELSISRNDNYCADEQSCIKEYNDGSCQLYGYCTEEKRKWSFEGESCEPKYNTCQTFRSQSGRTASYLENTLEYGSCNAGNAGCDWYCEDYNYASGSWNCDIASGNKIYFDNDAEECDDSEEGCHELIRTKPGIGSNLLPNSSFEIIDSAGGDLPDDGVADTFDWWSGLAGEAITGGIDGLYGLKLNANLSQPITVGSAGYSVAGQAYTLSFYAKNCGQQQFGFETSLVNMDTTSNWQNFKTTYVYPASSSGNTVNIEITAAGSCEIDAIKLERGTGTGYNNYRGSGLVYEKLAPAYLGCDGINDPAECNNFARQCSADEVGCEMYTSVNSGISIPAQVIAQDYCPAECVGYDTYIQKESAFDSLRDAYFIPGTARSCSAAAAGCDEFTNLDKVAEGGEGREYYISLRQCSLPNANCSDFYTWEGSDESGYQLRVYKYEVDDDSDDGALPAFAQYIGDPAVTSDDSLSCSEAIYNLPQSDPAYNQDCREFYNRNGEKSWHLYTRTITCSTDCHPYRRTENNIDPSLDQSACNAIGSGYQNVNNNQFSWDNTQGVCYFCKNGGVWDTNNNACIYDAIPGQGQTCSVSQNSCREYAGNTGNNERIILNNDFEGSTHGWGGYNGAAVSLSNTALLSGGNSLNITGANWAASTTLGNMINQGSSYVLSFIAKAQSGPVNLTAMIDNGSANDSFTGAAGLIVSDWRIYKLNLTNLQHILGPSESLVIAGSGNFYIDDIRLTEITNKYYLIKNSWNTPASCFQDINGNPVGALYNLGCSAYNDRDSNTHYLRGFNKLCQQSAVGCELMIDTHNYSDYNQGIWNDANGDGSCAGEAECEYVPADNYDYIVYDRDKECSSENKGCQLLGDSHEYEQSVLYGDIYLKNNPDEYNSILCQSYEVGCEEWTTTEGKSYFKDPGDQECEWRQTASASGGSYGWYKKKMMRCDNDGSGAITAGVETALCFDDGDCGGAISCVSDDNDYACAVDWLKTFGAGGSGNRVFQPTADIDGFWAGLCPAAEAGCAEYVDPISIFSNNNIFNYDFSQDVDNDNNADGWSLGINGSQNIKLDPNALYILSVEGNNTATINTFDGAGAPIGRLIEFSPSANSLTALRSSLSISSSGTARKSIMFYSYYDMLGVNAAVRALDASMGNGSKIELKKAVVDYQIKQELDRQTCNGIVNFEDGCVLFNERVQNGANKAALNWDADLTYYDGTGVTPKSGAAAPDNDSNQLLKVSPDRVCDKWLACRSIVATKDENGVEKNTCFDIGLCDSVDDNGDCNNFIVENKIEEKAARPGSFSKFNNYSGYTKVGFDMITDYTMKADYPLGAMDQDGEVANISNGNFEFAGADNYPIGWIYPGAASWDENVFKVIDNPVSAQTEGIGYAPEGRNFLKLGSTYSAESEYVDVISNTDYILTAYMNTINLSDGEARVTIEQYNSAGFSASSTILTYAKSGDWEFQLGSFKTGAGTSRIKVLLDSNSGTVGNFYFDDIKIKPALNSRNNWYTAQDCRLYPEDDSLSCQYLDDSGIIRKGWPGYCLEYDRYPGSNDACLLWWPVDKVKGDGIEEGAGYSSSFPVYYCFDSTSGLSGGATCGACENYDLEINPSCDCGQLYSDPNAKVLLQPGWEIWAGAGTRGCNFTSFEVRVEAGDPAINTGGCVANLPQGNGNTYCTHNITQAQLGGAQYFKFLKVYGNGDCDGVHVVVSNEYTKPQCLKLVQTVTSVGQNRFWSGRTYEGSNYTIDCNTSLIENPKICDFTTFGAPFGSIVPPDPADNPYEWDSDPNKADYQPLYFEKDATIPGMGQLHTRDNIMRIFAQSYGGWDWDGSRYVANNTYDWLPPSVLCNGTGDAPRPGYVLGSNADLCSILPEVLNIKVDNISGSNILLQNNKFISLTFNTNIDSEQLPMVMYAIDWGDGEKTVVSGVEMRDRPNPNDPHNLYHLYGYWDLKAKNATNQAPNKNSVYCGGDNVEATNYNGAGSGYVCSGGPCCVVKPQIKIKDNWGWCNAGVDDISGSYENPSGLNDCNQWEEFDSSIVVYGD